MTDNAWWDEPCVVCGADLAKGVGEHRVSFNRDGSSCNCAARERVAKVLAA